MFGRRKIEWLIPLILVLGIGAVGAVRVFASSGAAQQASCRGDGMNPEEQPVLEGLSQYEAHAGEEIVLSLYGGGYSQVEGVKTAFFDDVELPVQECAVISPGEMQVRLFFPEEIPGVDGLLVIILIANGDEAFVRSEFQVFPLEEVPPGEPPPAGDFPPEEPPPDAFPEPDGPGGFVDPTILIILVLVLGIVFLVLVLVGVFLIRRLLRGSDKTVKPPPQTETSPEPEPESAPEPPDIRFVHTNDSGDHEIGPHGHQPFNLEIRIELERDQGQVVIEVEDSDNI